MAEPSVLDSRNRFPLSYPQRAGYEAGPGALSPHFVLSMGFRLTGWVAEYARLVEAAVRAPEQDWRTL
jgi:hypothetical protein